MTTASAERSFSVLKRIETYLSTTISDERLTHLAMLSMHALESRDEPKILIWTSSLAVGTCVPNFSWNWTSSFREITTSTTNEPTNKLTWSQYLLVVVIRLIDWLIDDWLIDDWLLKGLSIIPEVSWTAARCIAVMPAKSGALMLTLPWKTSSRTSSWRRAMTATCSGVWPDESDRRPSARPRINARVNSDPRLLSDSHRPKWFLSRDSIYR